MQSSASHEEDQSPITFAKYGIEAWGTAIFDDKVRLIDDRGNSIALYPFLKLQGECGEVAEKLGKIMRDNGGIVTQESKHALMLELGDILWYVNACARVLGYPLSTVAWENIAKLRSRKERGKLQGSGDDR